MKYQVGDDLSNMEPGIYSVKWTFGGVDTLVFIWKKKIVSQGKQRLIRGDQYIYYMSSLVQSGPKSAVLVSSVCSTFKELELLIKL